MEEKGIPALSYFFSKAVVKDVLFNRYLSRGGVPTLTLYSTDPSHVALVIERIEGCRDLPLSQDNGSDYVLKAGTRLPMKEHSLMYPGFAWGGLVGQPDTCRFTLSVENAYGKAEIPGWFSGHNWFMIEPVKVDLGESRPGQLQPGVDL